MSEVLRLSRFSVRYPVSERCPSTNRKSNRLRPSVAVSKPSEPMRAQRWFLIAAAAVVLVVLPFIRNGHKQEKLPEPISTETDPDAVMNRVSLHLAQTVPAPMKPLLLGIPNMNP
jgi:hypothetical protein